MQKHATAPAVKALLFSERTPPRAPRACTAPLLARPGDTARPGGGEIRARSEARPRYRPAMDDADGYFGERVAATYDDPSSEEFDPAVIERTADVLAGLAGPHRPPAGPPRRPGARHRHVPGDGGPAARQAGRRRDRRDHRRLRHGPGARSEEHTSELQ